MKETTTKLAPLLTWLVTGGFVFAYPAVRAFVMNDLGWQQVGWAFYIFIVPMLAFTFLAGAAATVGAFTAKRREVPAAVGSALVAIAHLGFALVFFVGME